MSAPYPWFVRATGRVEQRLAALPPALTPRLHAVVAHLARRQGAADLGAALTSKAAMPYPRLTDAYRHDLGIGPDDERLTLIGEGAILLYLHVRAQDDLIDDPATFDARYAYAAEAFSALSVRAFSSALGADPRFFAFREATLITFLTAATWELDVYREGLSPHDDAAVARLGQKLLPLAIPLGAIAIAASRPADLDHLTAFAAELGAGLQIVNDVLNVAEDHASGRLTPVLGWLYAGGRATPDVPAAPIRPVLLSDAALDRALGAARAALHRASGIAEQIGASTLAGAARESEALVDAAPVRLLGLSLNAGAI